MSDLNVVGAACVACVRDRGGARRGAEQGELDLIFDGAVAIRDGLIVAVGSSSEVLSAYGDDGAPVLDASGLTVVPGLIECHSHPLFAGERHAEYAQRLAGASLAEIAAVRAEIEFLRRDLTIRLGSMLIVAVGILLAAMRYLPPH